MINKYWKYGAALLLSIFVLWSVLGRSQGCSEQRSIWHEAMSNVKKGEGDAIKAGEKKIEVSIETRKPVLVSDTAQIDALKRELAAFKANRVHGPIPPERPSDPEFVAPIGADPSTALPAREALVAERDKAFQIIAAQDIKIVHLEAQVLDLTHLADQRGLEAEARFAETVELRLALAAQKSAMKSAVWKTRIGGFAVGFGSGFVAGALVKH